MTGKELEKWEKEHDWHDINPDILHNVFIRIWQQLNGITPMPEKYPEELMKNIDVNVKVLYYDLLSIFDKMGGLKNTAGFRGYFSTLAEVELIQVPVSGDWAWCAEVVAPNETANIWIYDEEFGVWVDTGDPIPSFNPVPMGTTNPKMNGEANPGMVAEYAPIDHIHPHDITKLNNDDFSDYKTVNNNKILQLNEAINAEINRAISVENAKAPASHASPGTTYGPASAANYGHAKASGTSPKMNGPATAGSEEAAFARGDHVHPTDTSRAPIDSPRFANNPRTFDVPHPDAWDRDDFYAIIPNFWWVSTYFARKDGNTFGWLLNNGTPSADSNDTNVPNTWWVRNYVATEVKKLLVMPGQLEHTAITNEAALAEWRRMPADGRTISVYDPRAERLLQYCLIPHAAAAANENIIGLYLTNEYYADHAAWLAAGKTRPAPADNGAYLVIPDCCGISIMGAGTHGGHNASVNTPYEGKNVGEFIPDRIRQIKAAATGTRHNSARTYKGAWVAYANSSYTNSNAGNGSATNDYYFDANAGLDADNPMATHAAGPDIKPASISCYPCISY